MKFLMRSTQKRDFSNKKIENNQIRLRLCVEIYNNNNNNDKILQLSFPDVDFKNTSIPFKIRRGMQ